MRRALISVLSVAVFLAASAWFVWYFAYRLEPRPRDRDVVPSLQQAVQINWYGTRAAEIIGSDIEDAYTALGYAHGMRNSWSTLLLRQTALGRLGEWFGSDALEIDIAARMLSLDAMAKDGYHSVEPETQSFLEAYASGMNVALRNDEALRNENLVLLRIDKVDPWLPWHSIAVERLIAWLATTVDVDPAVTMNNAPRDLIRLLEASAKMKEWLALEGFSNSSAWAVRHNDITNLFYRLVYGSSVEPYVQEFSVATGNTNDFSAMSVVGTPFAISGKTESKTWAVLPHQNAGLTEVDSIESRIARSRITFSDGSEQLVSFRRTDDALVFPADSARSVVLSWPGLRYATDADAWFRFMTDVPPSFSLIDGTGIEVSRAGVWRIGGPAESTHKINEGVYVSHSPWSRFPSQRLANWIGDGYPINIPILKDDTYSIWAEREVPRLLALVSDSTGVPEYDESIEYLRNWDFNFNASSIAGAIFDAWATRLWLTTGLLPGLDPKSSLDSTLTSTALIAAVDQLKRKYGPDVSTWRWERVQMNSRDWPLWIMIRRRSESMSRTRFAPVVATGSGHPSSLAWGATSFQGRGRPPGRWESWIDTDNWRWTYSSDTNLDQYNRLRRTDAPFSTVVTEALPPNPTSAVTFSTRLSPSAR